MNQTRSFGGRVEPSSLTALLAIGDLVAIGIFVVAGEISHGYGPIENTGRVAGTMLPFVIGWVLVSVSAELYTRRAIASLRATIPRTLVACVLAVGIAQALRSTSVFHGDFALSFALVSVGVGGALLVTWRVLVTLAS